MTWSVRAWQRECEQRAKRDGMCAGVKSAAEQDLAQDAATFFFLQKIGVAPSQVRNPDRPVGWHPCRRCARPKTSERKRGASLQLAGGLLTTDKDARAPSSSPIHFSDDAFEREDDGSQRSSCDRVRVEVENAPHLDRGS